MSIQFLNLYLVGLLLLQSALSAAFCSFSLDPGRAFTSTSVPLFRETSLARFRVRVQAVENTRTREKASQFYKDESEKSETWKSASEEEAFSAATRRRIGAALLTSISVWFFGLRRDGRSVKAQEVAAEALAPAAAPASALSRSALFSAGDARFLQATFEGIRYKGISNVEVGRMADGTRAVRITYNPKKCSYKALLGAYWRNINPLDSEGQFNDRGAEFRPVIWATDSAEMAIAEKSRKLLEKSGVYGPVLGAGGQVMEQRERVPLVAEIRELSPADIFQVRAEDGQDFFKTKAEDYKLLSQQSGRDAFFKEKFQPTRTTGCQGSVCGFVYFPCTADNLCLDVTQGTW
eukprot:TRINITY_DN24421_c0_g1_i1.p1 TRINITY_DN24421_c0_g1~~TRINITY_DN24421_c0_g1_i1.p1  ORF type:complete len:364 (-),score=56.73 TRINITY_DN24421_c0_g1_i1:313-1359(-)